MTANSPPTSHNRRAESQTHSGAPAIPKSKIQNPKSRRWLVPEIIQTSAMDCGPAALKALLEGHDIPISYGRLREACQTSVDGTSIDTLEDVARQLSLQAEQVLLPLDHVLLEESGALPALVVAQLPGGATHFAVAWSVNGPWVQVLNPGVGRQWLTPRRFLEQLYIHVAPLPAAAWRKWAGSEGFLAPLRRRLAALRFPEADRIRLLETALADAGWRGLAALDAATRLTAALVASGGLDAGAEAGRALAHFFETNRVPQVEGFVIPELYWMAQPGASADVLRVRGAVLLRVRGAPVRGAPVRGAPVRGVRDAQPDLPPELAAALAEPPAHPERAVWAALRADGLLAPGALAAALAASAAAVVIQALLLQSLLRLAQTFGLEQRWGALLAFLVFLATVALLELPLAATTLRLGRRLEARLRIALLEKLPRLNDRYFHSRLISDMAQRAHGLRSLRALPTLGADVLRLGGQLALTLVGVVILQPALALPALAATAGWLAVAWFTAPLLAERDLRVRSQLGALSRFYLDGLLGLTPLRAHSAERAFRRAYEELLVAWARASFDFARLAVALQSLSALLYAGFAAWLVFAFVERGGEPSAVLLLFYWTLNLPALGQALVEAIQQYPAQRNRVLRLLEPLSAPEEESGEQRGEIERGEQRGEIEIEIEIGRGGQRAVSSERSCASSPFPALPSRGAHLALHEVGVQAGGRALLTGITCAVQPGEHLAIVGPSGAGKTTLVGLLLGWHVPAMGSLLVDGAPLTGDRLAALRRTIAWVDPAVQLWNRSLLENLSYGNPGHALDGELMEQAGLFDLFERLENGLQTPLGEGGGLVSGGEGQRVRLGRAFHRPDVRLALLDEPFRGLDRPQRQRLLQLARQHWREATLIWVTHDVGATRDFPRVLVLESGRLVEDAAPETLAAQPDSRYRALLDAEAALRRVWSDPAVWRRMRLEEGRLQSG